MTPSEYHNRDLARRACIARNRAKLEAAQRRLADRRKAHGRTVRIMHNMDQLTRRLLFLETGGDAFDPAYTRGLL